MKRFQSIIQKYITNHQKHKKYLAAVLALSILVSFAVPVSLIMPAVSMTQNDTNENYAQPLNNEIETYTNESTGTNEWFDTASDNGEGVDFENKITSITITDATKDSNGDYVINGGSGSSWSGSFTLNYAGVNDGVLGVNNPYMHCQINDVKITNAQYGKDCLFIDPSDSWKAYCSANNLLDNQGQPATSGYYSISENGMINIRFTSDYRNYLKSNTCEGSITFEGSIERGDDADGDREFTIGNNKIKVNFDDKNLGIRKSADWNFQGANEEKIRWAITIENGNYVNDLNNYFVEDSMLSKAENVVISPSNAGSIDSSGIFRISDSCKDSNGKYPANITITYEAPITDSDLIKPTNDWDSFKIKNIAKLKKDDGTELPPAEETKGIPQGDVKATITKSGKPTYEIDGSKGYVEWTIEVERKRNLPLKDYVITDEAFKNIENITINGDSATITDKTNGTLTLGDVGSSAVIKYRVPIDTNTSTGDITCTNKATLTPPDSAKDDPKDTGDQTVTYKKDLFDVTKSGVLNDKNQLTWTITIATINNNAGTLNGFKISDTQFKDAVTNGQLRIVNAENNYVDVTNSVSLNGLGNEYTINGEADKITLEFTRPLTTDEINAQLGLTGNNTANVTNTVTVKDKDDEKKEESGTATLTPLVDGIVKRLKSNNYAEETAGYDSDYLTSDKATKSLEWEVNIDHYRGFSSDSKVFVDVMNATNGGQHYMTQEQLDAISISGTTIEGNDAGITSSDYTIEKIFDSNNKIIRFNVTFNGTVDTKKCVHLTIGYNTTADASNVVKGNTAVFSNTASFGGKDAPGGNFSFEVKDPANVPKHNLTANKSWAGDTPDNRPDNIKIRLERKTGENGTWVEYAPSGQESTKTINKDSFDGYLCQWTDLEEYTPTADKKPYYYRVVELDGDNAVSNGGTLGSYTVSYNENGITLGGDGTFTITNTRALADITVHKDWVGDEGKTRPNAVVHLEWKYEDDNQWSKADGSNGADVTLEQGKNYSHTWNDLPKQKDGRTVLYRVVENELADYVTSYTNNNGINSNGTINITNTYKMIDISVNKVWQDENGGNMSAPDDINSLKFQLQYKHADSFEPAGTATSITDNRKQEGSTWKYYFNLPFDVNAGDKIVFNIKGAVYGNASGCLGWNGTDWQKIEWNKDGAENFTKEFIISDDVASDRYFEFQFYNNSSYPNQTTVEYQIQKKKDGFVSDWTEYPTAGTQTVTKADGLFSYTWNNIPIVDENGNSLVYQVVEVDTPRGYEASYSSSDDKNFTVTNKQSATYSKQAIRPIDLTSQLNESSITPITSISQDELDNWPTKTINGVECYIFEWYLKTNPNKKYCFVDELPDGASLYYDTDKFNVMVKKGDNSIYAITEWNEWVGTWSAPIWNQSGSIVTINFASSNSTSSLCYFIYCTAIPKETVDSAVNTNGSYDVINKIKTNDEPNFTESKLTITKSTAPPVDESLLRKTLYVGKPDSLYYQNGTPTYELIVNPEGKNLVNGDTIDITDIFEITGYKPNGGTKTDGSDLLDVDFNEIQVQLIDENGKRIRDLLPNEYNRLTNTEEVEDVDITNYTGNFGKFIRNGNTNDWKLDTRDNFPKDLEVCLKVKNGTSGKLVNVDIPYGDAPFVIESDGVTYDDNGEAEIKLLMQRYGNTDFYFRCYEENLEFEVVSTQIVKRTTSTKTKLQLSVPDEMPLKIVYSYKLKTNSKTLGVSGDDIGKTPPAGSVIYLKNAAEFETSSEKAFDEEKEMEFQISKSSATVNTTEYPTIKKVDIGNYSLELNAGFRIAKYDNGTWKYASQFNDVTDSSNNVVSHSPNFSIEEIAGRVPTDSAELETVAGGYKIVLDSGALYKLVEVERPDGYIDLGYKSDSIVTGKKPYVFYFTYDGTISDETLNALNNGLDNSLKLSKSDIMNFQKNSTLNIPNSNTFSIKVEKEWGIIPAGYTPVSVDVKLGWSYSKLNKIPDSLNELSALGINGATKTITGIGENGTLPSATWDNLPNGYDGKPIYYYVKEISYKLKDSNNIEKTYTLNNDGTYKCDGETGDFKPIYTGNGLNTGYSVEDGKVTGNVHIKNASKLVVKKVWQDSNGEEITDNLPLEEIQFNLDGIKEDGTTVRLVTNGNLKASGNWLTVIDNSVFDSSLDEASKELSQYKQFKVAEVITNDNQAIMYGYIVSDTYNVTEGSGEIVLTNKDKTPKDINVTVNKVWGDGNDQHTNDSIEVVLIRSNKSLTSSELKELNLDSLPSGITKVEMTDNLKLNSENNWTKTWENLPYRADNGTQNYYYVLEKIIPDGYEVSYSHNGSLSNPVITINNNVPGSFKVSKSWVNASYTPITEGLPDSITVEIYQKLESTNSAVDETKKIPDNLKVYALGDSITKGTFNGHVAEENTYPNVLKSKYLTENNGYNNSDVNKDGEDGRLISQIKEAASYSNYLPNADVVCIIAGTNDIINSNSAITGDDSCQTKLIELLNTIYQKNSNAIVFVGSIPKFSALDWSNSRGIPQVSQDETDDKRQSVQLQWDKLVNSYNTMVENVVKSYQYNGQSKEISFVDIHKAVGTKLVDGCHPTAEGYDEIAKAFYNAINKYYVGETVTVGTPQDINGLPDNLGTTPFKTVTMNPDENGNWSLNLTDLSKSDGNGNNYVYYVKEINIPTDWEASYKHNGQLADSNTQIEIINTKATEKINITVNKKWNDGNASDRPDSITLTLQRKTETEGEWSDVEVTQPTPTKNGNTWTYTYSNLPKDDGNDNNYQYRIVETVPTGYTVEYVNGGVSGADGNISLTNTKSVSIKLNKIWSDNDHMGDTIIVKLHRSTTQKGDASLPLVMSINGQASMQTGSTQTLTANRNNIIWSSSDTNVATINSTGLVTAIKHGTTIITAKCGSETATFVITVSDKPTVQLANSVNITLGENASDLVTLLGISMSDGSTATYSYSGYDSSVISISDGKVTALKAGNTTITVTATSGSDTSTATATINVNYPATFSITGGSSVSVGSTLNLGIDNNNGKFTWLSSDKSIATVNDNGVVTGKKAGKVIITATRDDSTEVNPKVATKEITVQEGIIDVAQGNVEITLRIGDTITVTSSTGLAQLQTWLWDNNIVSASGNGNNIIIEAKAIGEVIITYLHTYNTSATTFKVKVVDAFAVSPTNKELAYGDTVTLSPNMSGNITYEIIQGSDFIDFDGSVVTAKSDGEGTAIIRFTNNDTGEIADVTITVSEEIKEEKVYEGSYELVKDSYTTINPNVNIGKLVFNCTNDTQDTVWIAVYKDNNKIYDQNVTLNSTNSLEVEVNGNCTQINIGFPNSNDDAGKVISFYGTSATATQSYSLRSASRAISRVNSVSPLAETSENITFNSEGVAEVKLTYTDVVNGQHWQKLIENLPAYDKNNQQYYYWVEEIEVNGYTASYYFDDASGDTEYCIDAAKLGSGEITIKNTKNESSSVTMPSTGGKGVKWYYVTGMAVMFVSAAGILIRRRKNPVK